MVHMCYLPSSFPPLRQQVESRPLRETELSAQQQLVLAVGVGMYHGADRAQTHSFMSVKMYIRDSETISRA